MKELISLLSGNTMEVWISLWVALLAFIFMWYKGKLPSVGEFQDITTVLNSRGGNILILAGASIFFFYRSEHMYYTVIQQIKDGTVTADNGIALNGLTFDTGAFGAAFGALLKTMSPDAPSPASSTSTTSTTTTVESKSKAAPATVDVTTRITKPVDDQATPSATQPVAGQVDVKDVKLGWKLSDKQ